MNSHEYDPMADVEAIRTLIAAGFTVEPLYTDAKRLWRVCKTGWATSSQDPSKQ